MLNKVSQGITGLGILAPDGSTRITESDGSLGPTLAPDGSIRVSMGDLVPGKGVYAPDGSLRIKLRTSVEGPLYAADGSLSVYLVTGVLSNSWVLKDSNNALATHDADYANSRYYFDDGTTPSLYETVEEFHTAANASFSRSTTATYRNSTPLLTTAAIDALRFQHDAAGSPLGALLEGARTNLAQRSEQIDQAPWAVVNAAIVTANAIAAPDGATTADKLRRNTSESGYRVTHTAITVTSDAAYSLSAWAKAGEVSFITLDTGQANIYACFNVAAGTVGTVGANATGASIEDWGNGWYRCILRFVSPGTSITPAIWINDNDNDFSFPAGNDTDGAYLWGAQLEAGAFPSAYIPTIAAAVTRAIDAYAQTVTATATGAVVIEGRAAPGADGNQVLWQKDDGTAANHIRLVRNGTSLNLVVTNASVDTTKVIGTLANDTSFKVALRWADNDFEASLDGAATVSEIGPVVPAGLTNVRYGSGTSGEGWFGTIKRYTSFSGDNIDVQALST